MTIWALWREWKEQRRNLRKLPSEYHDLAMEFAELTVRCLAAEEATKLERGVSAGLYRKLERERAAMLADVPNLTPGEIERLATLAGECGDVVQAVAKILRYGWASQSPYGGRPNRSALEREIGSVRAIVNLMLDAGDVRLGDLQTWQRSKRASLGKWTLYQECSMPRDEQLGMMREIAERNGASVT